MLAIIGPHPMEIYILCAAFLAAHYATAFFVPPRTRRPKHPAAPPAAADDEPRTPVR